MPELFDFFFSVKEFHCAAIIVLLISEMHISETVVSHVTFYQRQLKSVNGPFCNSGRDFASSIEIVCQEFLPVLPNLMQVHGMPCERKDKMKKLMVMVVVAATAVGAFAGPHGGGRGCGPCRPCGPGWGPRPYHGDWWGRGGCNFWPGFVGGVVGGLTYSALATPVYRETVVVQPTPTVVTQPVVVQQPTVVTQPVVVQQPATTVQNVWVEGAYIDKVQPNGTTVRVWNPGHYELR